MVEFGRKRVIFGFSQITNQTFIGLWKKKRVRLSLELLWMVLQEVSQHSRCYSEGRALTRCPCGAQFYEGGSQQGPLSSEGV